MDCILRVLRLRVGRWVLLNATKRLSIVIPLKTVSDVSIWTNEMKSDKWGSRLSQTTTLIAGTGAVFASHYISFSWLLYSCICPCFCQTHDHTQVAAWSSHVLHRGLFKCDCKLNVTTNEYFEPSTTCNKMFAGLFFWPNSTKCMTLATMQIPTV